MIIFLYGKDTFRSREKLKQIKDKFSRDIDKNSSSLDVLDGEKISLEKINETVAAPSLFVKRRMVVIENIFKNKDKEIFSALRSYFEKKEKETEAENDTIIVFWDDSALSKSKTGALFKFLSAGKIVQEFKEFSNIETNNWIKTEAKRRQASIKSQAAARLSAIFGNDLWQLSNELNKLINFKRGEQPGLIGGEQEVEIGIDDVNNLARGNASENIFALTDAISTKNKGKALELLENELHAGAAETYLLSMIIRQFKILIQVRSALDDGMTARKIQNELKLHPYVVQKTSAQARNFSLELLKKLYQATVDIDYELKTGQADIRTALSVMIGEI
ncbi:MAG: DNA polymerase III subunit delta [Patescibacteria group bacterium]|nr:DNA polymerase III subunit delta [Patescibacteria group bacterium]